MTRTRRVGPYLLLAVFSGVAATAAAQAHDNNEAGAAAYHKNCAFCHDTGRTYKEPGRHVPKLADLRKLPIDRVRAAVTTGRMRPEAVFVKGAELEALIRYVTAAGESDSAPVAPAAGGPPGVP
jgi:mono/diheme cytochrome c family protein